MQLSVTTNVPMDSVCMRNLFMYVMAMKTAVMAVMNMDVKVMC